MKLKNNQSGIAHLAILAVIVVVAVIAVVAYRVTQKKDTPTTKNATKTTQSTSKTADSSSASNATDATKFLTIKEWGVKFALTGATADAYYDTKTSSTLDSMSLRSHSLDSESDCTTAPLSVAGIFRVSKDTVNDQTGKKYSEGEDGKTIGDYYYFIQSSQYMCTENVDKAVILQGVRNRFNVSGPTIVKS